VLSLGLLLPFGTGSVTDGMTKALAAVAAPSPAKHVTLVRDGSPQQLETRAATAQEFLAENGIVRATEDALSVDPESSLTDGETIDYRPAVAITIVVDNQSRTVRTAARSVADLLRKQGVDWDKHDRVSPRPASRLADDETITVTHVNAWTEEIRKPIAPATVKHFALGVGLGKTKVIDPGAPGVRQLAYLVTRGADRRPIRRSLLVSRVLRAPKTKIVAEGIGDYAALSKLAERGMEGTIKLAGAALSMVATAYTAQCSGCSGVTAIGVPAGHGVVAVDPHVIPLGTKMFIPGYGKAVAGDTGGAIIGHRIDLGFNSIADALSFGRREITVYLLK
jgi:3D (Asp-Asp-Asp) domain-containing protein/uncharacterized protein YabE (DUF348 family)